MDNNKKKLSKKNIIMIVAACVIIPVIAYCTYISYLLFWRKAPTFVATGSGSSADTQQLGLPTEEESGIENIVLFGVDNRTPNDHGRTDSIIIATVDKNSKVIKLTSVMRDLYVKIGSTDSMSRINAAYAIGGPELALETLNRNFGLDLKYYAIIDFKAFQELVDKLGGVDVEVKDYEVNEINKYITEVNGKNATLLKNGGFQHLNGQQALSFARIRKVGNGDYERTERQRIILKALMEKAKQVDLIKITQLIPTLVSYVQTNVPVSKVLSLGVAAYKFNGGMQSMRIPVDGYFNSQNVNGASVLVPDINANAQFLKEFIYNIEISAVKDVPSYMQNNFHMDDSSKDTSKPKPNIPDYSTPSVPLGEGEEQVTPELPSSDNPGTEIEEGTDTTPGKGDQTKPDEKPGDGSETEPGEGSDTAPDNGSEDEPETEPGDTPSGTHATP